MAKLHIGIDAKTMQIRAICVTSNNVSDAAVIADFLGQLSKDESLESVTGDRAYDTKQVYEAVIDHGAIPLIPPRKNARLRKGSTFVHRKAAILNRFTELVRPQTAAVVYPPLGWGSSPSIRFVQQRLI